MIKKYAEMQGSAAEFPNNIYKTGKPSIREIPNDIKESYYKIIRDNPTYSLFYFTDDDCKEFIKKNYDSIIYKCYLDLVPSAFRADYFRYLLLYHYGGVYMDFSFTPIISIHEIMGSSREVYVKDRWEAGLWNGFICARKGSLIIENAIQKCTSNILNRRYTGLDLAVTGPYLLAEAYREVRQIKETMDSSGKDMEYMVYMVDDNCQYVIDHISRKRIAITRSLGHYDALYGSGKEASNKRYHNMWRQGRLYRDPQRIEEITELYHEILNRDPDESGLDHWHNTFLPISQIRDCMMNSEEKRNMPK